MASTSNDCVFIKNARQRRLRRLILCLITFLAIFSCVFMIAEVHYRIIRKTDQRLSWFESTYHHTSNMIHKEYHDIGRQFEQFKRDVEQRYQVTAMKEIILLKKDLASLKQSVESKQYVDNAEDKRRLSKENADLQRQLEEYHRRMSRMEDQLAGFGAIINLLEMEKNDNNNKNRVPNPQVWNELAALKSKVDKTENVVQRVSSEQAKQSYMMNELSKIVYEAQAQGQKEAKDNTILRESVTQKLSDISSDLKTLKNSKEDSESEDLDMDIIGALLGQATNMVIDQSLETQILKAMIGQVNHILEDEVEETETQNNEDFKETEQEKETFTDKAKNWAEEALNKANQNFKKAASFMNETAQINMPGVKKFAIKAETEMKKAAEHVLENAQKGLHNVKAVAQVAGSGIKKVASQFGGEIGRLSGNVNKEVKKFFNKIF